MKIYWDKAGNNNNVGRETRYIYVEWEDPRAPNPRLLIDITWNVDDFVENYVIPSLSLTLEMSPPVYVRFLSHTYVRGENEFLIFDARGVYQVLVPREPYRNINYKRFWKRFTHAKLHTFGKGYFIEALYPELSEADAVEIDVGNVATFLVPKEIYDIWLKMRDIVQSFIQRMEQLDRELSTAMKQQTQAELELEFE
ncbi:MAG: hypothetical protein JHC26_04845 [Thermofilum sp.]|jgi:hypothetical protein|uniref:hypothetical protein n=1 Tax=Thermofilum sp. TaxID=1961369 RepID=UPI00258F3E62|nr:hypothetical protein [Thermofilum sp.]MCI4408396.1 hypothetical protein [Thermofilum sp.]